MIETKIKTLDLFAPLAKGGTVGLVARPGMGQLVVLTELYYRLRNDGFVSVLLKPEADYRGVDELVKYADIVLTSIDEAYEEMVTTGKDKDVLFTADRSHVMTGKVYELQERLENVGVTNVTTFLVDLKGEAVDEDLPYGPLETLWHFDADLAARHKFLAINPLYSTSSVLEGEHADQSHFTIQQRAQKILTYFRKKSPILKECEGR